MSRWLVGGDGADDGGRLCLPSPLSSASLSAFDVVVGPAGIASRTEYLFKFMLVRLVRVQIRV